MIGKWCTYMYHILRLCLIWRYLREFRWMIPRNLEIPTNCISESEEAWLGSSTFTPRRRHLSGLLWQTIWLVTIDGRNTMTLHYEKHRFEAGYSWV